MVGHFMLMKILHCRRHSRKHKHTKHQEQPSLQLKSITSDYEDDKQYKCRVCLKSGHIPIYGNASTDDVSECLSTIGAIEVRSDDEFPKHLCEPCYNLLQGAILLRKTAQQSDIILRQPPPPEPDTKDYDEDFTVDDYDNSVDYEDVKVKKSKKKEGYSCKKCSLNFKTFKEYSEHRLSPEHENKRQTCPVCKRSYTTLYFKKHLALHTLDTPYMCDICGKKFIIQGQFTRHRVTHFYDLPFKCDLCPYRGRFSESLKLHMRTHTGEKPYICTQCPSRFVNKSNLNKHLLTHKGDHDFKCESCGRGFYTKRNLELHFKVDHTGIKEHICNICGKAFGYRKQMMKHQLKVHKREKLRSGRLPLYLQVESRQQQEQQEN